MKRKGKPQSRIVKLPRLKFYLKKKKEKRSHKTKHEIQYSRRSIFRKWSKVGANNNPNPNPNPTRLAKLRRKWPKTPMVASASARRQHLVTPPLLAQRPLSSRTFFVSIEFATRVTRSLRSSRINRRDDCYSPIRAWDTKVLKFQISNLRIRTTDDDFWKLGNPKDR